MTGTKDKKKHNKQKSKDRGKEKVNNVTKNTQAATLNQKAGKEKGEGSTSVNNQREEQPEKNAADMVKDAGVVEEEKDVQENTLNQKAGKEKVEESSTGNNQGVEEPTMVDEPRTNPDYKLTIEIVQTHSSSDSGNNLQFVFENFPFQDTQRLVCRPYADEPYQWYLCDFEKESSSYTLLVTYENTAPSSQPPPTFDHILPSLGSYKLDDSNGGRRQVIWYPRFKPINDYIDELLKEQDAQNGFKKDPEDQIAKVMLSYVMGLLQIHENKLQHGNISGRTMGVNRESGFLIWNPVESKKIKRCPSEFVDMSKALKKPSSTQNSSVVQNILKGLGSFKYSLKKVKTLEHCKWMQLAPFVLSAAQKVYTFIPRLHPLTLNHYNLKHHLKQQNFVWEPLVRSMGVGIPEMLRVLEHDPNNQQQSGASQQQKANKYDFFNYLRNCVNHLHDQKDKMNGGEVREDYSELLLKPSEFVSLIHRFGNGIFFLDDIFSIVVFKMGLPCIPEVLPSERSPQPSQTLEIMPAMKVDSLVIYQEILRKFEPGKPLRVLIPEGIFNYLHEIQIRRTTIDNWLNREQLQTESLLIYVWFLARTRIRSWLKFLSPLLISPMSCSTIDVRANYVANVINANANSLIFIAPYHYDYGHWGLLVLLPRNRRAYWIDSLHANVFDDAYDMVKRIYAIISPSGEEEEVEWHLKKGAHQPNGDVSDSGYYMLTNIRDLVCEEDVDCLEKWAAEGQTYSELDIDNEETDLLRFVKE